MSAITKAARQRDQVLAFDEAADAVEENQIIFAEYLLTRAFGRTEGLRILGRLIGASTRRLAA